MLDCRLVWPDLPGLNSFAQNDPFLSLGGGGGGSLAVESTTRVVRVSS